MGNGKLLEELKAITEEEEKSLPTRAMNRLMLAAMVELYEKIDDLKEAQNQCAVMIVDALKPVKKNPMVSLGEFIQNHPKITISLVVLGLVMSNIWFIDEIRYNVLLWLKVPEGLINLLVHHGG